MTDKPEDISDATEMKLSRDQFETSMLKVATLAVAAIEAPKRNDGLPLRYYDDPLRKGKP